MSVGAVPYAGAKNISECEKFIQILKKHTAAGKVYGAICAAPAEVLGVHGLIPSNVAATSHPAFQEKLSSIIGEANYSSERVVVSAEHKLITSRG
mmetsp:Transcript_32854/g.74296  ORF Transcript_32854/g.74296 Transcript_32854/m.74296 type:complete len:95 (-) Transcript_32854:693-977(-)